MLLEILAFAVVAVALGTPFLITVMWDQIEKV